MATPEERSCQSATAGGRHARATPVSGCAPICEPADCRGNSSRYIGVVSARSSAHAFRHDEWRRNAEGNRAHALVYAAGHLERRTEPSETAPVQDGDVNGCRDSAPFTRSMWPDCAEESGVRRTRCCSKLDRFIQVA